MLTVCNRLLEEKFCCIVKLDSQKAFSTVDQSILYMELRAMGFRGLTLNWVLWLKYMGPFQSPKSWDVNVIRLKSNIDTIWIQSEFQCQI